MLGLRIKKGKMESRGKRDILRGDAYGWMAKMERVSDNAMLKANMVAIKVGTSFLSVANLY